MRGNVVAFYAVLVSMFLGAVPNVMRITSQAPRTTNSIIFILTWAAFNQSAYICFALCSNTVSNQGLSRDITRLQRRIRE